MNNEEKIVWKCTSVVIYKETVQLYLSKVIHLVTSSRNNGTCDITMDWPPAGCDITMDKPPSHCDASNKQGWYQMNTIEEGSYIQ